MSKTSTVVHPGGTTIVTTSIGGGPAPADEFSFYVNGKKTTVDLADVDPKMTLLEYLRSTSLTGTKVSCNQGGCGACTVMLTKFNESTGKVENKSVNACLRPVLSMAGQMVTTTEGIGSSHTGFHPVQERIAACNGTQCGFCTPGHVMAMYSLLREKDGADMSPSEIEERFDGNICRCTGYRPIMTAVHSFASEGLPADHEDIAGAPDRNFSKYDAAAEPSAPAAVAAPAEGWSGSFKSGATWLRPTSLKEVLAVQASNAGKSVKMICGNTSTGVYPFETPDVFVDISAVAELRGTSVVADGIVAGATTTITELMALMTANEQKSSSFPVLVAHMKKVANWQVRSKELFLVQPSSFPHEEVANWQVRNVGSWAGNLVMAKTKHFASDIATLVMGAGATVQVLSGGQTKTVPVEEFLWDSDDMKGAILLSIKIPFLTEGQTCGSYRAAQRPNNAHALLNACFTATVADGTITAAKLAFGVADLKAIWATDIEAAIVGKPLNTATLEAALAAAGGLKLIAEPQYHTTMQPEGKDAYRRNLVKSFLYKFFIKLTVESGGEVPAAIATAALVLSAERPASTGTQIVQTKLPADHPGSIPMPKIEAAEQCSGETIYHDDMKFHGELHAAFVCATQMSEIVKVDPAPALKMAGVQDFVGPDDCGMNVHGMYQFPLFAAAGMVPVFNGMPVGCIVATSRRAAEAGAKAVEIYYAEGEPQGLFTMEAARAAESFIHPPGAMTRTVGEPEVALAAAGALTVSGEFSIGGQSHFCMEKHTVAAVPDEQQRYTMYSSCQWPATSQIIASVASGIPTSKLTMIVKRCGGGFGGKIDGAMRNQCAALVCAKKLRVPVKMQNDIETDMKQMGSCRHPISVKYKAAADPVTKKWTALDVQATLDGGSAGGFSDFVAAEVLNNCESVYHVPNLQTDVVTVQTNTPPNTAVRAPGLAQAIAITETVVEHLAGALKMPAEEFRVNNLQSVEDGTCPEILADCNYQMQSLWSQIKDTSEFAARHAACEAYNAANKWKKRGISMTPMKYSLVCHLLGAGTVTVNVNSDGSVDVHHSGTELGQGLTTKVGQMAAVTFGIPISQVNVFGHNSDISPNSFFTGGSVTSEMQVAGCLNACTELLGRLAPLRQKLAEGAHDGHPMGIWPDKPAGEPPSWNMLCSVANAHPFAGLPPSFGAAGLVPSKTNLSCSRTAVDGAEETGNAPAVSPSSQYWAMGTGVSEVEVDVLTGETNVIRSDILYDCGDSLNPIIDVGQAEGAFIMGQGYFMQEEILYNQDGTLASDGTWEYKPLINSQIPQDFRVQFVKDSNYPKGVKGSKASGEPPFLLSVAIVNATKNAIRASRVERGLSAEFDMDLPCSVDRVQMACGVASADMSI